MKRTVCRADRNKHSPQGDLAHQMTEMHHHVLGWSYWGWFPLFRLDRYCGAEIISRKPAA